MNLTEYSGSYPSGRSLVPINPVFRSKESGTMSQYFPKVSDAFIFEENKTSMYKEIVRRTNVIHRKLIFR